MSPKIKYEIGSGIQKINLSTHIALLSTVENPEIIFQALSEFYTEQYLDTPMPEWQCFSPGRLNLIGDHIDYCGGLVMPSAVNMGTYALAAQRTDGCFSFVSTDFPEKGTFSFDDLEFDEKDSWLNYPKGVIKLLRERFPDKINRGLNMAFKGNLPLASGLSSSASLLLAVTDIAKSVFSLKFSEDKTENAKQTALFAQRVENEYIGLNCGIMDQGSIVFSKKGYFMAMDCSDLKVEYLPCDSNKYSFIIANTNKPRQLAESKYNQRKIESEKALFEIQKEIPVKNLCQIRNEDCEQALSLISDPVIKKRARHIISENLRVIEAKNCLCLKRFDLLGKLLTSSHLSLKNDYEVTGKELDVIALNAVKNDGVAGARMTGAGFSGCAVILCEKDKIEQVVRENSRIYKEQTDRNAEYFLFEPADGVSTLKISTA